MKRRRNYYEAKKVPKGFKWVQGRFTAPIRRVVRQTNQEKTEKNPDDVWILELECGHTVRHGWRVNLYRRDGKPGLDEWQCVACSAEYKALAGNGDPQ